MRQPSPTDSRPRLRGSAMTELVIMIFPYAICLIGLVIFGHLALGKQESQKLSILAAPLPGDQGGDASFLTEFGFPGWNLSALSSTTDTFLAGVNGVMGFSEDTDFVPDATRARDEPVLPYGRGANDISAGFTRLAYEPRTETTVVGGEPITTTTTVTTQEGAFLLRYAIMSAEGVDGREPDIETLLGDWLMFSEARTRYGFAYGGSAMPMETADAEASALRARHTLNRRKPALDRDEPDEPDDGYAYYSASRNHAFWYGTAQNRGPWQFHTVSGGLYDYTPERISRDEDFDRLETVAGERMTPSALRAAHVPDIADLERLSDITYRPGN